METIQQNNIVAVSYAGFWKRAIAGFIDLIALGVAKSTIRLSLVSFDVTQFDASTIPGGDGTVLVVALLYFTLFESSHMQATPGKRGMSIRVTDSAGNRLSLPRSALRNIVKPLSFALFGIGFLMIAFSKKKQGLHGLISGTLVVNTR